MIVRTVFILVLMLILIGAGQFSSVWACSGYPYFGIDDLPTMDLLVRHSPLIAAVRPPFDEILTSGRPVRKR